MDSHTHSAQAIQLEVVETGRLRRWSEDEKLRIVAESLSGPRFVSTTARRHGISPGLLYTWLRTFRLDWTDGAGSPPGFVPAVVVLDTSRLNQPARRASRREIVLGKGHRIIVDAGVDAEALALERR